MGSDVSRISVIIPALDEENYLGKCIASVRKQSYDNYEIIVVANGCTDKTPPIAKKLADKSIVIKEKGVSHARNIGAKAAAGSILVFIDADSAMSRNLLNKIYFASKKGYYGGTCNTWPDTKNIFDQAFWGVTNFVSWIFRTPNGMFFVDKDVFFSAGMYDESLTVGEDTKLLHAVAKKSRVRFIKSACIWTSMRRFRKQGYAKTIYTWISAFFSPKKVEYEAVR